MKKNSLKVTGKGLALVLAGMLVFGPASTQVVFAEDSGEEILFEVTQDNEQQVNGNDGVQYEDIKPSDVSNIVETLPPVNTQPVQTETQPAQTETQTQTQTETQTQTTPSTENTNVLDDRNYDGTYVDEIPDSVKTEAERKGIEDVPTTPTEPEPTPPGPTEPEPTTPEPTKPEPTKPIESTPIVKTGFKEDVAKYGAIGAVAAAVLFALANIGVKVSETGSELMMVTGAKESSIKPKKSRKNTKRK